MSYNIPLFDLNFDEKEQQAVLEVIRSKWISTGPKTTEFENKFAGILKVQHAVALTNCTVSLHLALKVLGINAGDEVICPSLTFVATVNAIRYLNAIPVFADIISFEDLTIDPKDVERKITSKTKAIIVMHYGGFSCAMDAISDIAKKYNLKVVEDACHGPLSEYKGNKLGTIGDIGCFSFFSNKNISTGEGGMMVTNNEQYFKHAKLLRSHGMTSLSYERSKGHSTGYDVIDLGYNYRMDDIRAAIGIVQLDKIETDVQKRGEIRKAYIEQLDGADEIIIPFKDNLEFSSNYIFPVVLKNSTFQKRNLIRRKLADAGIQSSVHYPAVHRFTIYKEYYVELSKSDYVTNNMITLPMFAKLSDKDVSYICTYLKNLSMNTKVIIIGAFHEIIELAEDNGLIIAGLIDNEKTGSYMDRPIIGNDTIANTLSESFKALPLILSPDLPAIRERLMNYYDSLGFTFISLVSKKSERSKSSKIDIGTVVQSGVNISSESKIGSFVKINTAANIMHNVNIGDFTTIAPNAVVLGNVIIGKNCYVGSNATILPNVRISDNAIIGAGAVVTKNIYVPGKYIGCPARKL